MSEYKLVYFNMRGIAEPARFLLKYGGLPFEDVRLTHEDWSKIKQNAPFGFLPYLEYQGKQMGQSMAIARYLGKLVGLGGKDDWENLEIDAIADTLTDMRIKLTAMYIEKDEEKRKVLMKEAAEEVLPGYLRRFEERAEKNGGYLAAPHMTWADLVLVSMSLSYNKFSEGDALGPYPNLVALREKIHSVPAIKEYLENRPKTDL